MYVCSSCSFQYGVGGFCYIFSEFPKYPMNKIMLLRIRICTSIPSTTRTFSADYEQNLLDIIKMIILSPVLIFSSSASLQKEDCNKLIFLTFLAFIQSAKNTIVLPTSNNIVLYEESYSSFLTLRGYNMISTKVSRYILFYFLTSR